MTPVAYALAIQSLVFSFALLFYRQKRIPAWKNFTFGRKIIFSRRSSFNFLYKYCLCFQEKCQLFKETHLSFCTKKEYHIYRKKEIASLSNMLKITLGKIIFHSLFKRKHHIFEKKTLSFPITLKISDFNLNFLRGTSFLKMFKTELWFLIQCIETKTGTATFSRKGDFLHLVSFVLIKGYIKTQY